MKREMNQYLVDMPLTLQKTYVMLIPTYPK